MYDAILLAGGRIDGDFAHAAGTDRKGLLTLRGKRMVEYVIEALRASGKIGRIGLVGPPDFAPSVGSLVDAFGEEEPTIGGNLRRGAEILGIEGQRVVVAACDSPCLTGEAVSLFLELCPADAQIVYPVVTLADALAAFPRRKWFKVPLKGMDVVATGLMLIEPRVLVENERLSTMVGDSRGNMLRMFSFWGLDFLLKFLLRRLSIEDIERRIHRVTGLRGKGVLFPIPEAALDVDCADDMKVAEEWLARRGDS